MRSQAGTTCTLGPQQLGCHLRLDSDLDKVVQVAVVGIEQNSSLRPIGRRREEQRRMASVPVFRLRDCTDQLGGQAIEKPSHTSIPTGITTL